MSTPPLVIVGAGLAGTRCAITLRRLLSDRPIELVGDETHAPYERPPLSKELLTRTRDAEQLTLPGAAAHELRDLGIDVRPGTSVASIEAGSVELDDGRIDASAIVLATGATPRRLPTSAPSDHVHVLRSLDDGIRLRAALEPGRRLAIVGSGFIGAEVASSALARGVQVTIVEAEPVPFGRTLGADVGGWLTRRWRDAGVDLRTGTGVAAIRAGDAAPVAIELADGTLVEADDVLVAIGTVPRDQLFHAAFAGLGDPGRGIPTDIDGRTPIDGVFAAGDVALVDRGNGTDARRLEHWTDAAGAAVRVAHAIAGATQPRSTTPYAWSDQFGIRLQVVGRTGDSLTQQVESLDADRMLVRYVDVAGTLRGVLGVGHPSDVARYRARLLA